MRNNFVVTALFFFLLFGGLTPVRAEPEMTVAVDRTTIYEGESIEYQVVLTDSEAIDPNRPPDLSAFTDFEVVALPPRQMQSSSSGFRIVINNKEIQSGSSKTSYTVAFPYKLTPKKTGSMILPPPRVVLDGRTLKPSKIEVARRPVEGLSSDGTIPVTVDKPDDGDDVFVRIEVNRNRLYPLQPLTVSAVVFVKEPPKLDPMAVRADPPGLTIPWIEDNAIPKGLSPQEGMEQWLSRLNLRRGRGFTINEYAQRSFFDVIQLQFLPKPVRSARVGKDGKEAPYLEYRFERSFLPEEIGTYSFGPAVLKGVFPVAAPGAAQGVELRSIYSVAPAVSVEVLDVPEENRPEGYIGAFGRFNWSVDFRPRAGRVGEPMSLTLRLTGKGSAANVKPPDLAAVPGISDNFRIYPPTEEVKQGECVFSYTVRPTRAGTIVVPPIPIAYFDVEKEQFVSLTSDPISLEITEAEAASAPRAFGGTRRSGDLEQSDQGLFANRVSDRDVIDRSVDYRRLAFMIGGLVPAYLFLAATVLIVKRFQADPRRRRRNGALGRARRRLDAIRSDANASNLSPEQLADLYRHLKSAMCGYIADRCDAVEEGMTTKDACEKWSGIGVSDSTLREVRALFETLDGARYGGLDLKSLDSLLDDARRILSKPE